MSMPRPTAGRAQRVAAAPPSGAHKREGPTRKRADPIDSYGRGEKIRTSDPLHPMQVRYQAALRPDANERL